MARQLWLLRHADAEPQGTRSDAERKLTARGERQGRIAGLALARMGADFDVVLVSPKVRAERTAEIAGAEWSTSQRGRLRLHPPLAEGFDAEQTRQAIEQLGENGRLLLVGHEPDLSGIVRELTGGLIDLKKGGVAMVRLDGAAGGELALLLRPRELAPIAGVPAEGS